MSISIRPGLFESLEGLWFYPSLSKYTLIFRLLTKGLTWATMRLLQHKKEGPYASAQVLRIGVLGLLVVLAFGLTLVRGGNLLGQSQPVPGKGIVYATREERAPNGAIVKPQDLGLGVMVNIVSGY
jgi:hypothetical protein